MYRFHPFLAISKKINLHVTEIDERVNNFFFTSNLCLPREIYRNEKRFLTDISSNRQEVGSDS